MVRISRRELRVGLVGDMQPDARWRRRDDCCPSEAFARTDACMHASIIMITQNFRNFGVFMLTHFIGAQRAQMVKY